MLEMILLLLGGGTLLVGAIVLIFEVKAARDRKRSLS
ncbi:hypothetical protein GGE24_000138 [Bradyrhizobium centrosematis]|nr:hypothetical protein [Bradyrhizobium centrosematis]MCS3770826.1 hypothetical protein [Bradyrhizobium centrosematis]